MKVTFYLRDKEKPVVVSDATNVRRDDEFFVVFRKDSQRTEVSAFLVERMQVDNV